MKVPWHLVVFASLLPVQAQIIPNQGLANNGIIGIRGVTVTNLMQTPMAQARNFFIVGGIDLRPNPQNQSAGNSPSFAGVAQAPANATVDQHLQYLTSTRDRLAQQHIELAGVIAAKQRARQPWAAEARQHLAMQRAIQQLDAQIAQRSAVLKRGGPR